MVSSSRKRRQDLGNQLLGLVLALGLYLLFIVWMADTPALLRYGVTGALVGLIVIMMVGPARRRSRTEKHRRQQLESYRNGP